MALAGTRLVPAFGWGLQATDSEMTELLGRFGLGPWLDRLECGLD